MAIERVEPGDEAALEGLAEWVEEQPFVRVLDVGGGDRPLRAATNVIDLMEYGARRVDEGRGKLPESFSERAWLVKDCNERPWPYRRGFFDFVWCSQLVEDIRDPVGVCKEMMRVGKAGIISTVSRDYESSIVQDDGVVGYHHHRWLVELMNVDLCFTWKSPILHVQPEYRPKSHRSWLQHFKWEGRFNVCERFVGGDAGQRRELLGYLKRWEVAG